MRVMCIQNFLSADPSLCLAPAHPLIGDEDVVIGVEYVLEDTFFALERFGSHNFYRSDFFATLPEQTAEEMEAEVKEAILM